MGRQLTFDDERRARAKEQPGWGGLREGAGRKAVSNPPIHHIRRANVPSDVPAHVILRVKKGIPSLRSGRFLSQWRTSLRDACERQGFRVVHYSVQTNHVHLLVEAPGGRRGMANGMKSIAARFARCVNRAFGRRGPVLYGRYNLKLLKTPRQVRNALAYVLLNARKHWRERHRSGPLPEGAVDPCSSGGWFDGWKSALQGEPSREPPEIAPARFWLLRTGWRRHGLVALS